MMQKRMTTSKLFLFLLVHLTCITGHVEANISGIMDILRDTVGGFQDLIEDPHCTFKCPRGFEPTKNPVHKQSSNGCGAFGIKIDQYIPLKDLTKCCDKHDHCYDTCNESKAACDQRFHECLKTLCKKISDLVTDNGYQGCLRAAGMFYAATVTLGCQLYKESQKKACICTRKSVKHTEL